MDGVHRQEGYRRNSYFYHNGDGLCYHFSFASGNALYFKCVLFERGCRGRALFKRQGGFRHTNPHNHDPDIYLPEERSLRARIVSRSNDTPFLNFRDILEQERSLCPREVASRITLARMRTTMRNTRMARYPPIPTSLLELGAILQSPEFHHISQTVDASDNVFASTVVAQDGSHHVLFTTQRMRMFMSDVTTLHGDGTFSARPRMPTSSQVFTILSTWRDHIIPLAWVLMDNRTEEAYTAVFQRLRALIPNLNPRLIISDFESAQQNAWNTVFPQATIQGCLWHFCRAIVRYAKKKGLHHVLQQVPRVKNIIRMCCALPLLPRHKLKLGFLLIVREARLAGPVSLQLSLPVLKYVFRQWVANPVHAERMCVFRSKERTNNVCECANRWLKHEVGAHHPNVFAFIGALARIEGKANTDVLSLLEGRNPSRSRAATSIANDARILRLTRDLSHPPAGIHQAVKTFLQRASYTLAGAINDAWNVEEQ